MVMNYNINMFSMLVMIGLKLPRFLEFTIPMSVTISILLTFMRMSSENEILALKSAGISIYKILPSVLIFCFLGAFLTLLMTVYFLPWANLSFRQKIIAFGQSSSIDILLKERQFNSKIEGITVYASHTDIKTHHLKDVIIEDRRNKGVVSISTAPSGEIIRTKQKKVYAIRLYNGIISLVDVKNKSVNNINFQNYDIQIDLAEISESRKNTGKKLDERNLNELIKFIRTGIKNKKELNEALMEVNEKFSVPFACLTLGILAVSLGIQLNSMQRSTGYGIGLFFFLLYYLLLVLGWSAGETGLYPPFLGMWMPNVVLSGAGVLLFFRTAKEKPLKLPISLFDFGFVLKKHIQKGS